MKNCSKCGTGVDDNAVFCNNCGKRLIKKESKEMNKVVKVVGFVVLLVAVLVVGIYVGNKISSDSNKSVSEINISSDKMSGETTENYEMENQEIKENSNQKEDSESEESNKNRTGLEDSYNYVSIGDELSNKKNNLREKYPEMFSTKNSLDGVEGWIDGDLQVIFDINHTGIHFTKAQPRDIRLVCYSTFDGQILDKVTKTKYSEDFMMKEELETVPEDACFLEYGNVVKFTKEYMETLEPGYYEFTLYIEGDRRSTWPMNIVVHDETEPIINYRLNFTQAINYYSTESKNDVLFYLNGSTSPIKYIHMDGKALGENECDLICDGYAIVLHPEFLEKYSEKTYIELDIRTESNLWCTVKVIFLNHAIE